LVSIVLVSIEENIIEKHPYVSTTSKHSSKGIRDNSHQNLIFLKLKLGYHSNSITTSTNSKAKLLYGEVDKTK
jgi:hypothetical protein